MKTATTWIILKVVLAGYLSSPSLLVALSFHLLRLLPLSWSLRSILRINLLRKTKNFLIRLHPSLRSALLQESMELRFQTLTSLLLWEVKETTLGLRSVMIMCSIASHQLTSTFALTLSPRRNLVCQRTFQEVLSTLWFLTWMKLSYILIL